MVLNDFLISDSAGFLRLVNTWPSTLYKLQNVINAVKDRIEKSKDPNTQKDLNMVRSHTYANEEREPSSLTDSLVCRLWQNCTFTTNTTTRHLSCTSS
jgi:hypothetical protein